MIDTRTLEKNINFRLGMEICNNLKQKIAMNIGEASKVMAEMQKTHIFVLEDTVGAFKKQSTQFYPSKDMDTIFAFDGTEERRELENNPHHTVCLAPEGMTELSMQAQHGNGMIVIRSVAEVLARMMAESDLRNIEGKHNDTMERLKTLKLSDIVDPYGQEYPSWAHRVEALFIMNKILIDAVARPDFEERYATGQINWLEGNEAGKNELIDHLRVYLVVPVAEADLPRLAFDFIADYLGK